MGFSSPVVNVGHGSGDGRTLGSIVTKTGAFGVTIWTLISWAITFLQIKNNNINK